MLVLASGCGNRLPHDQLLAAAGTRAGTAAMPQPGSALPAGATVDTATASNGASAIGGGTAPVVGADGGGPEAPAATGGGGGDGSPSAAATCDHPLSPVVIASVGQQSGLVGALTVVGTKGVQAWVAMVNARGGVNCHPVKYLVADDGGDPSRHQSLVQEMVEQNGVQAFVYQDAVLTGQASVNYLTSKRIPVIGTENSGEFVYQSPMYFPQASSGLFLLKQPIFAAKDHLLARGLTHVGLLSCIEAAQCGDFRSNFNAWATEAGLTPVWTGQASLTTADFTSSCQQAQSAGVQALVTGMDASSNSRIARSCESVGYHPQLVSNGQAATQNSLQDSRLDGFLLGVQVQPPLISGSAAVEELKDAMARYAPGVPVDSNVMVGWTAAKLFEAATQHLAEPPTSASILDGLWSVQDNDLGGLTYPMTFTRDQNAPHVFCYWLMMIKDGQFVIPNDGQRACS
jgi:ABC-type branched-subunit amino acid transport system substrate-binding protein